MEINNIPQISTNKAQLEEKKNSKKEAKQAAGDYNKESRALNTYIPFTGLNKTINAKSLVHSIKMDPEREYLIDNKAGFYLYDTYVNLQQPEIKPHIDKLGNNQFIVIGKEAIKTPNMNKFVSRKHLKIRKDNYGRLLAQDLHSLNGTTIAQNVYSLCNPNFPFPLKMQPEVKYLVPENTKIKLHDFPVKLTDYRDKLKTMKNGDSFIIGRGTNADITIDNDYISRAHLKVEKHPEGLIVQDLNSLNGSTVVGPYQVPYVNDFSEITTTTELQRNVPTLLPKAAQIHLGHNLTIDLRNKNILKMLDEKGTITIGRDDKCDLKISDFHDMVSRQHLKLTKTFDGIVATDTNSYNGTKIVPKNEIKPFYESLKNMRISQGNIGDCFLLSAIYGIAQHPLGEKILNNMVKVDDFGNYIVKFHNTSPIKVAPEELDGQKSNSGEFKRNVSGELGLRAIERAYGKKIKFDKINQLPNKVIERDLGKTLFMEIDQGGSCYQAMQALTGAYANMADANDNVIDLLDSIKRTGGLNRYVLNCSTPKKGVHGEFMDRNHTFVENHMYAIKSFNLYNDTIEIVNPHDTRYTYTVSADEFGKYFDYIYWTDLQ